MRSVTILMYHNVRELGRPPFPELKGLSPAEFRAQLDEVRRRHTVVGVDRLRAALLGDEPLPADAAVLTFDDGLTDHWDNVLPVLLEEGLPAGFFPAGQPVLDGTVLDVNKVHFILGTGTDADVLNRELRRALDELREAHDLRSWEEYWRDHARPGRLDPPEVNFFKRMLQHILPAQARHAIAEKLFRRFVTTDEAGFAGELYMSADQLRALTAYGLYVGGHTHTHPWLDKVDEPALRFEIEQSLRLLERVDAPTRDWILAYPYGAHSPQLRALLPGYGCLAGVTTRQAVADLDADGRYELPRVDTSQYPLELHPQVAAR